MQKLTLLLCLVILALASAVFAQEEDILRDLSASELRTLMPGLSEAKANQYVGDLNSAMRTAQINTPQRQAAFLAQLGHESGNLKWFKEFASGKAYEGRKDLGNVNKGDGVKYKGRGPIQITGRSNYAAAGKALGVDLVNNPDLAASPKVGFQTAAWYWNTRGLNKYADKGTQDAFDTITKRINGGFNGKADRDQKFRAAQKILNGNASPAAPAPTPATRPTQKPTQRPQVAQRPAQQKPTQRPTRQQSRQQTRPSRQQTRPSRQQTRPSRQQTRPSRQQTRPSRQQSRPSRSSSRSSYSRPSRQQTRPSRSSYSRPSRSSSRSSYSRPTRSSYSRPSRSSSSRSSYSRPTRSSYSRPSRSSYSRPSRSSSSRSSYSRPSRSSSSSYRRR